MLSPLQTPHLFTHRYDIDDLIAALCAPSPSWLDTTSGSITPARPTAPESHTFLIEPLPASFLNEIAGNPDIITTPSHLSESDKTTLISLLSSLTSVTQLPHHFDNRTGGWLRERVKDAALEWLDANDLIPPSMRHINRKKAAKLYNSRTVTIEDL